MFPQRDYIPTYKRTLFKCIQSQTVPTENTRENMLSCMYNQKYWFDGYIMKPY